MARAIVHIVRHGETDENRQKIIQGQLDTVLNAAGLDQARRVAGALRANPFDVAFSSDLSRAVKTAETILAYHPTVQLQKIADLRERHMGNLQGQAISPTATASGNRSIETMALFASRAVRWWNKFLQYLSTLPVRDTPYEILVVSHGGWIGALVRTLVNSRKLRTAEGVAIGKCLNVSVTRIEMDDNRNGTVTKYGNISHLVGKWVETNADELYE
ncbi:hypothetical protein PILCRDRAFT_823162 [Piloderma croceum F 1598]|uniref:Phosphoglycerate mutase-like protein n=1 Tax=Piloderma croceum (strain F 1598) TaxID=765440 RepID=A0A0C3F4L8_PILCF|nr:hypothetical protein PILCRDRAFT_823162 [Piloderma croceum F 1598]